MEDNILHLNVWPGDWDLPSVDPNCLATLAYCHFSGVPVKIHKDTNPWRSPSGNFPWMRHKAVNETKVTDIFTYLRKQKWGSDFNLSVKQSADVVAYFALMEEKLLPGILHLWWMESKTYTELTRPFFYRATPIPFKFWIPSGYLSKAEKRIYVAHGNENIDPSEIDTMVYREAKDCLTYLSQKLGEQDYFFGNLPSSLDALVFGYVAPLLNAPLNSNQLTNHIRTFCENLCSHCNRILKEFFPLTPEEMEERRIKQEKERAKSLENLSYPNKTRNMILAGAFATTVMTAYAFANGIVSFSVIEDEDPLS